VGNEMAVADSPSSTIALDIIIPVYNEGRNIQHTLTALGTAVRTPCRILICYDFEEDDTLAAVKSMMQDWFPILFIRNKGRGAHQAILSGFAASSAPFIMVYPADDDYNAAIIDRMVEDARAGNDIVCACRFMPGGCMVDGPWLKRLLVRVSAFTLYYLAGVPTRDSSNGFRLFSRRLIETVQIESVQGFTYSIELLVKAHRLRWPVADVPARWFERKQGTSRFRVIGWLGGYLRWYFYAFATTYFRRPAATVPRTEARYLNKPE
jgi:glycosyltransferase involved in cell wall biosynthesis